MGKQSTERTRASRPTWDTLEDWLRGQVQGLIQRMLEDEVTEFVGRTKSQRGAAVEVAGEAEAVSLLDTTSTPSASHLCRPPKPRS